MDPYHLIKESILTGKYEPKQRLTEEGLANELSVSRTPIREAIKQLESEGLITPLKRGVIVRSFTNEDIRQIYDLRGLIESYAANQAALYRTNEDIDKMIEANNRYGEAIKAKRDDSTNILVVKEIVEANQQFHETIIAASKNEHIRFLLSKVVVVPIIYRSFYWYNAEHLKRSHEVHNIILHAIKNKEGDRAKVAMHEHIYSGRDRVLIHLEDIQNVNLGGD